MKSKNIKVVIKFKALYDDVKYVRIEKLLENVEKNKDPYYLSILQIAKCEVKSILEFSNYSFSRACHVFLQLLLSP